MKLKTGINKTEDKVSVGSVRQSQIITTFGVGSMVDFVNQTAMISGTDKWTWFSDDNSQIHNINLQSLLGVNYFVKPKLSVKERVWDKPSMDIPATIFPKWLYNPSCKSLTLAKKGHQKNGKFMCFCDKCQGKSQMLPSRFVLVCPEGHIEDFPYHWWIHGTNECKADKPIYKMYYVGNKTDMDSLFVECSCGLKRSLKGASAKNAFADYHCHGNRPWLGDTVECSAYERKEYLQLRIRNESSVYFPATVSALTIPPWSTKVAKEIQKYIGITKIGNAEKNFIATLVKQKFRNIELSAIKSLIDKLLAEKDEKQQIKMSDIMRDEYEVILFPCSEDGNSEFISHQEEVPEEFNHIIDKVIAIDRLTVVTAMVGFSRLKALGYSDPKLCPLSKTKKDWYPAVEQKGEGIFIKFNQELLHEWTKKHAKHYDSMKKNVEEAYPEDDRFSPQYVFLHTFAHLFIRELSNLCGYSAASIKERIYSTYQNSEMEMAGVLIYTSTADSDGSLGGLTEQAKKINCAKLIHSLLERGKWCSSDPVCYTSKEQGYMSLNYAACFACTLLPETSCEFRNVLLDRCSVCGSPKDESLGVLNWKKNS